MIKVVSRLDEPWLPNNKKKIEIFQPPSPIKASAYTSTYETGISLRLFFLDFSCCIWQYLILQMC
jgi:hypothetical protein